MRRTGTRFRTELERARRLTGRERARRLTGPERVRPVKIVAAVAALGLLVGGCAAVPALRPVTGESWAMPSPTYQVPTAGSCYRSDTPYMTVGVIDNPVELKQANCAGPHLDELIYVGEFGGAAAKLGMPPLSGPPEQASYAKCVTAANAYLGGDWHSAWVDLRYYPPTAGQWRAGARFYRCDLLALASQGGTLQERAGSFKDGLLGNQPLVRRCGVMQLIGTTVDNGVQDVIQSGCTAPHDAVYVAAYTVDKSRYPSSDQLRDFQGFCSDLVAAYLGINPAQWPQRNGVEWLAWGSNRDEWNTGQHAIWCWLIVSNGTKVRTSLAGLGLRPLPH